MIDFQGLLAVMAATENNPNVHMGAWNCGTTQCMIGSFCVSHQTDRLRLGGSPFLVNDKGGMLYGSAAIAERFRITPDEALWLFVINPLPKTGPLVRLLTKEQALSRLRKFIYYKLHKQEMVVEQPTRTPSITLPRNISGRRSAMLASKA